MSPSRSITGVRMRTVRPSLSLSVTGTRSLVGQPCQLPVFAALAGSELIAWSIRRKSGTAPSSFVAAMYYLRDRSSFLSHSGLSRPSAWLPGTDPGITMGKGSGPAGGDVVAASSGRVGRGEIAVGEAVETGPARKDPAGDVGGDAGVVQNPARHFGEARIEMRKIARHA